jgi:hypothetical protein
MHSPWWRWCLPARQASGLFIAGDVSNLCSFRKTSAARQCRVLLAFERRDRAICDAKVFDFMDLKLCVHNRYRIAAHFRGTRLIVQAVL